MGTCTFGVSQKNYTTQSMVVRAFSNYFVPSHSILIVKVWDIFVVRIMQYIMNSTWQRITLAHKIVKHVCIS